jgi:hypothetical protein
MCAGRSRDQYRLGSVEGSKGLLEIVKLRHIEAGGVRVGWIPRHEVLVIIFGRIGFPVGLDLGDDRGIKRAGLIELCDIGFGDARLLRARRKDGGPVLRADVRTLAIEWGRSCAAEK